MGARVGGWGWDPGFSSQLRGPGGLPCGRVGSGAPSLPCPALCTSPGPGHRRKQCHWASGQPRAVGAEGVSASGGAERWPLTCPPPVAHRGAPAQPQPTEAERQPPGLRERPGHLPGPPAGAVAGSLWPGGPGRHWLPSGPGGGSVALGGGRAPGRPRLRPPVPQELYVSYNSISDLSPLCLLEQLEVLDLEGNSVEDLGQAPQHYNYRAEVRKLIPHLQVLDEVPATHTGLPASRKLDQDWLMVKEAIKEGRVLGGLLPGLDHPHGYPIRRLGLELSLPETQPRAPRPWPLSLLVPGGPLPEGLLPTDPAPEDVASTLTHGAGPVLCGNPTKGLRERQHQCPAPPERLLRCRPEDLAPSTPTPGPDPADSCDLSALAGLPAWRELGLRHLESQQEGAEAPWRRPRRGPEEQEDETGPHTPPSPLSLAPEPSRTVGYTLLPCPPKLPVPPDSSSSNQGSTGLQFRARRLRALGSSGPGLGQGLAAVAALRALEVGSGPSPRARGCLDPKPTQDPAARSPALRCLPHLSPVTPAQTRP
ncbi:leucine-rich repeat-containing protein 56 isoform X4 [Pteropus alecto]|uniref:leucine-rich repeat-containing protein 56 isoform X4 n=1 Tax=Pteropus alecto TaxID=9402 RepID=UPI000D53BD89|nr:leucine-rich repeat-containing protein 56 isoform X4 [Pteropus alecto]